MTGAVKPKVTISVPMWRAEKTVRRTVDSLLGQTEQSIVVVVTNDGGGVNAWAPLADIDDPRLIRVDSQVNRGRYAADHAVLQSCDTVWFAICDADDWAEPGWVEHLLSYAKRDVDVVLSPHMDHALQGSRISRRDVQHWDGTPDLRWHAHMAGLWRTKWAVKHHVTNPYVRLGWDSVMTAIPFIAGRARVAEEALYHRVRTANSLTTSRATSAGSTARQRLIPQLRSAMAQIVADPDRIPEIVQGMRPICGALEFVSETRFWLDDWSMDRGAAAELDARLHHLEPGAVLEVGSGLSTAVIGAYAAHNGARHLALENATNFAVNTRRHLARVGGGDATTEIRVAPLRNKDHGPWYDTQIQGPFQFALIDAPAKAKGGRQQVLHEIIDLMEGDWEIWLDDGDRPEELAAIEAWQKQWPSLWVERSAVPKGLTRIRPNPPEPHVLDASGVAITLLTGHRPEMLRTTLRAVPKSLLESADLVYIVHDGGDAPTQEVLEDFFGGIKANVQLLSTGTVGGMRSIGANMSELAEAVTESGSEFWLHLEDDWEYATFDASWLDRAKALLAPSSKTAQVRLRHISDRVQRRHMVTQAIIDWVPHAGYLLARDAHLTFNPSLLRVEQIPLLWPATSEKDMQRKATQRGLRQVAQMYPGVFRHIGEDSARRRFGSP